MSHETPPTALELARRIRNKEESCVEIVARTFDVIDELNPELHAFVSLKRRRALAKARLQDQQNKGGDLPPFYGVPIGIKDLHPVRGTFTRMGSASFRWFFTPFDDPMVKSVRKGGFNIIGKLSTSEFGLLPIIEPDIHPPTRNPHDPTRSTGGSSGGSAAAVASGMLSIAPGSDGGGSIRIPSAYCGLFGIKPSRGLIPNYIEHIDPIGLAVVGPIARSVADGAALLDVMVHRPLSAPHSFHATSQRPPRKLKVALCAEAPFGEVAPELADAARGVARQLEELGHDVIEVTPPHADAEDFVKIYSRMFAAIPILEPKKLQPVTRWFRDIGKTVSKEDARRAHERLVALIDPWLEGIDLLVTPTTAILQPEIGQFSEDRPEQIWDNVNPIGVFTAGFNASGHPAASIPSGRAADGMPLGTQLIGRRGRDALVLQVARQLEEAMGGFDPLKK